MMGWQNRRRIVAPSVDVPWMTSHAGPSCAVPRRDSIIDLYVSGRDRQNRSLIGKVTLDVERPEKAPAISAAPVLGLGALGTFDDSGVSYPCLVRAGRVERLYYTGWTQAVSTPFHNHLGLASRRVGMPSFRRVSAAPILPRTDVDPFSIGSCFVMREGRRWRMWYTSFLRWGELPTDPKHIYVIRYAESKDGISWNREGRICIDRRDDREFAICRPSVIRVGRLYHMWYCFRGDQYRIGYATSTDGLRWTRRDGESGIAPSSSGWDSEAQSYPHVVRLRDMLYLFYCGNDYGRDGVGFASRPISDLPRA